MKDRASDVARHVCRRGRTINSGGSRFRGTGAVRLLLDHSHLRRDFNVPDLLFRLAARWADKILEGCVFQNLVHFLLNDAPEGENRTAGGMRAGIRRSGEIGTEIGFEELAAQYRENFADEDPARGAG